MNADNQLVLFDYDALDADTRTIVQQRTGEIRGLMRRAAEDIISTGLKLIEVKTHLSHGAFGPWLKAEFEWDIRQAQRFMSVAERFGKCDNLSLMAPSALYLLASPSTPDSAIQEAVSRAETGQPITHAVARDLVRKHNYVAQEECPSIDLFGGNVATPDDSPTTSAPTPARPVSPYPHSDRMIRWLRSVLDQTSVIQVEMGGITSLLAEPDKWDWWQVNNFIVPTLAEVSLTLEGFLKEIVHHANQPK